MSRPRFLSVGVKLAFATVSVLALVTTLVVLELTGRERESILGAKTASATAIADLMVDSLIAPLDFHDADAVGSELSSLRSNRDLLYASVWAADENEPIRVLSPSGAAAPPAKPREDAKALSLRDDRLEIVRPVTRPDGKRLGTLYLSLSLAAENAAIASTRKRIFWLSLLVVAGTATILLSIARRQIGGPLDRMMFAALRIEKGERDVRVAIGANDEFGRLAAVFNDMSAAIVERERRLADATRRLRELFDHMHQAIVVFGRDGLVEKTASAQASIIFGQTSGRHVKDLLYPQSTTLDVELQAFLDWLPLAIDSGADEWSELIALAPKEATLRDPRTGDLRYLGLEFEPIRQDGHVARIMLLATDETEVRLLENEMRAQEEEHGKQMARMRRLLAGGGQVFVAFLENAEERLDRGEHALRELPEGAPLDEESRVVDELFQLVHTVKGEATAFGLGDVAIEACKVEDGLDALRSRSRQRRKGKLGEVRRELFEGLTATRAELSRARELFVEASPIGRAILDQITVRRSDVDRLFALAEKREDDIGRLAHRLASRPFSDAIGTLVEKVPVWADAFGKRAVLEVSGGPVLVPPRLTRVLPGVMAHLVRNAVAHGIETIGERRLAGKRDTGLVRAACSEGEHGPVIVIEDDGGGLREDALRKRAGAGGDEPLAELAFLPGVTTTDAADDLSGRGMGLSAARDALREAGFEIRIESTGGKGTRFVVAPAPGQSFPNMRHSLRPS